MREGQLYRGYWLLEQLGQSARSERWMARTLKTGAWVQIKRYKFSDHDPMGALTFHALRGQLAALTAAPLPWTANHEVHGVDDTGALYAVTRWVEGRPLLGPSLEDPITGHGLTAPDTTHAPMSVADIAETLWPITRALMSAATLQTRFNLTAPVIHGFIHWDALLWTPMGIPILTGFDRVWPANQTPLMAFNPATLRQPPPEVLTAQRWSTASDVYALGMILNAMRGSQTHAPTSTNARQMDSLDHLFKLATATRVSARADLATLMIGLQALMNTPPPTPPQMSLNEALGWLRGPTRQPDFDAVASLLNLQPALSHEVVLDEYVWAHTGAMVLDTLASGEPASRLWRMALASLQSARQALREAIRDPHAPTPLRSEAALILGLAFDDASSRALVDALNDPSPRVRARAMSGLRRRPQAPPIRLRERTPTSASLETCGERWQDLVPMPHPRLDAATRYCQRCHQHVVQIHDVSTLRHLLEKRQCAYFSPPQHDPDATQITIRLIDQPTRTITLNDIDTATIGARPEDDLRLEVMGALRVTLFKRADGHIEVTAHLDTHPEARQHHTFTSETALDVDLGPFNVQSQVGQPGAVITQHHAAH